MLNMVSGTDIDKPGSQIKMREALITLKNEIWRLKIYVIYRRISLIECFAACGELVPVKKQSDHHVKSTCDGSWAYCWRWSMAADAE